MTITQSMMAAGLGAALLTASAAAEAHPGYPKIIDEVLRTSVETFLPPTGCQLCHHSTQGADELREFGSLLVSDGLSSSPVENDASLRAALPQLPKEAVEDLRASMDPNGDPTVFVGATPAPSYGCAVTGRRAPCFAASTLAMITAATALAIRNRTKLRSAGSSPGMSSRSSP